MRLTHVRLLVDDFAACFRFYRDVVGLARTFGDETSGYADFKVVHLRDPPGNLLELFEPIPMDE
jgi:catechol 2,3-dioxygenase-like lactoylglutathione lyase family enzyme